MYVITTILVTVWMLCFDLLCITSLSKVSRLPMVPVTIVEGFGFYLDSLTIELYPTLPCIPLSQSLTEAFMLISARIAICMHEEYA